MPKSLFSLAALAFGAVTVLAPVTATAASYSIGDLFIGFVASGGKGANETLIVNLGPAAAFRDAYNSGAVQINFLDIGTQLTTQFSDATPWYERTDLRMNIYGATGADTIGDSLLALDPFQTAYVGRGRATTSANFSASSQNVSGSTAMTTVASGINAVSGSYGNAAVTADASRVAIVPDSLANTLDEYTRPVQNSSFGAFASGIDQPFTVGDRGNSYPGGPSEAVLDLYRIQGRNDVAGQYGQGQAVRTGIYSGTFTINSAGGVSFVPEPGSTAVLGLTGLLALARRNRRRA